MIFPLVWLGVLVPLCSGTFPMELEGSEGTIFSLDPQEKILGFHMPLFPQALLPYIHQIWSKKMAALSHLKPKRVTVTSTKTIVLQTVRHEKKHLVCYKARHGLPACLPEDKEGSYILPTAVPDYQGATQYLGVLDSGKLTEEEGQDSPQDSYDREQRHLIGEGLFKSTEYITKTLWVTRVEDYINTAVTATLLAANCVPSHSNIPPCPQKVEHYVHYDLNHNVKPIWEQKPKKEILEDRKDNEQVENNQKEEAIDRRTKNKLLDISRREGALEVPTEEITEHFVEKKTDPID